MFELKPIFSALMRSKLGAILLLLQITITMAIVSNAAFIIVDRASYLQEETGYPEEEIIMFGVYTFAEDANFVAQVEQTQTLLRELPGVSNAAAALELPLSGSGSASNFGTLPIDQSDDENYRAARAAYTTGDEHMFDTLGLSIAEGRGFMPSDVVITSDPAIIPSVVVSTRAFLDEVYPDGDGLGKEIYIGNDPVQIIGVIEQAKGPWLRDDSANSMLFFPVLTVATNQNYMIRTSANMRDEVIANIEEALLGAYSERVVRNIRGMDEAKRNYNSSDILMFRMLVTLISVLLLVTALGIFGMTTFNISKRTKQIGTRRALGARKSSIIRYFLVENAYICISGVILGTGLALFVGHQMMSMFELPRLEVVYVIATAIFIMLVSQISVLFPASKAANISPSIATKTI